MFGRYRIVRTLGQGGMGSVYLAHDSQLDRQVALKVPHLSDRDGPEVLERFYREARAAAALDHPNLCPVFDVGQVDGSPYLTMAYVEGRPLSMLIGRQTDWPQRQVAAVVRKLANALQEAHDRGVVHRDLKPANILVSRRKELVVVDFGLARRDGAGDARLTRSGVILGTPAYMAPEQVAGEMDAVGPCSDIYALGVILYELLAGRPPFEGPVALVLGQVMVAEPEPPSRTRPDVDPRLESACLKALAKKPADRFGSMTDFAAAMTEYLRGGDSSGTSRVEMPTPDVTVAPQPTGGESLVGHFFERLISRKSEVSLAGSPEAKPSAVPPPTRPRRRWPVAAGAAALLCLLLGVILYVKTDEGTVRIELSDPAAQVEVKVDGKSIAVEGLGEPLKLRVGEHQLEVEGKD
jgi:serine/threonine protein kinase